MFSSFFDIVGVRGSLERDISSLRAFGLGVGQISRVVHQANVCNLKSPRTTKRMLLLFLSTAFGHHKDVSSRVYCSQWQYQPQTGFVLS